MEHKPNSRACTIYYTDGCTRDCSDQSDAGPDQVISLDIALTGVDTYDLQPKHQGVGPIRQASYQAPRSSARSDT